jgi:hypothetical protein
MTGDPSPHCGRVDDHAPGHAWTTPLRRLRGLPPLVCPGAPTLTRCDREAAAR